jgi:hypothetical protein
MRTSRIVIGGLSCLLLSSGAAAQVRTGPFPPGRGQGAGPARAIPIDRGQIGIVAIEPFESGRPVTDAPYTAQAVTDMTQILADGNRIKQRTAASIARDSKGRTRREEQAMMLGGLVVESPAPIVTIDDPATRTHITLDSDRRVAIRVKAPPPADAGGASGFAASRGKTTESAEGVKTELLGEKEIDGVRVEGTRTTMTIEAETIGNQSAIKVVSERWYSPELQVVLLTQRSDPRFGETVYRLTNIVREEPSADLFKVPPDYRIEEQTLPPPRQRP